MPPHQTITNLGAVKAQSIAYDNTKAAIAIPQVSTADTFTTLNATQTLTNKTLTTPVIASLKQTSNGGTIDMPTVASGSTATLATASDITTATSNMVTTDTTQTITGGKIFTSFTYLTGGIEVNGGGGIDATTYETAFNVNIGDETATHFRFSRQCTDPTDESNTITRSIVLPSLTATGNPDADASLEVLATVSQIPNTSNMVTTDTAQTITGQKTLTTPVIASLKQASNGGTINMPTVASGQTKTLATTADIPTLPNNLVTTDTTQTITGEKTFTRTYTNSKGDTVSSVLHIPEHTYNEDYIVTTQLEQTLYNKEIVEPILAGFRKSDSGGFIIAPDVQAGISTTLATILDIPDTSNMVTINQSQTITGQKTLTNPILTNGTHTISMPAALTENSTFATATDIGRITSILSNLLSYLRNWADVGNLNMNDIIAQTDSSNYLGLQADPS